MDATPSPEPLMRLSRNFQEARIVLSAAELRLFDHLNEAPLSVGEVAAAAGISERGAEIVLDALTALGLLAKTDGRFLNTPLSSAYLTSTAPTNILGVLDHSVNLWDRWSQLTEVVRSGQPALRRNRENSLEAFILAMDGIARGRVAAVVDAIDLSGVKRVLDIGGGPGTYSCEFARRKPDLQSTVFDFPDVLVITRRIAQQEGLGDRIACLAGDVLKDDLGTGYDLILISAVIHSLSPSETRLAFRRAFEALNPGGQIVVQDFFMDDTKTQPPAGAIFAVNMLVGTEAGTTYSATELRQWLAEVGFCEISRKDPDNFASLLIARKPQV